jgi:N-acetyl sugar amidotransferase
MSEPLFKDRLRYCVRCCQPETEEGIAFDDRGVCNGCTSSEEKMHIDWEERERVLRAKLEAAKERYKDRAWDCLLPISGGKDSFFQAYVLTRIYGMRPLAATFSHNWFSPTGKRNLERLLETFDVDHIMFTPKRGLVNRLAKKSIAAIGDSCWHCHAGVGAFVLQVAIKFRVPMIVWGESAAEEGCRLSYYESTKRDIFNERYFLNMSAVESPDAMAGEGIDIRELEPFQHPTAEQYRTAGIEGFHLGDYMFWDEERHTEFIKREFGWEEDSVEGTYKRYKSVECIMPGMHDWTKFLKRGYGRASDHASRDVRAGLLTREEGFEIISGIDPEPPKVLDYFLDQTGLSKEDIVQKVKALRKGAAKDLP